MNVQRVIVDVLSFSGPLLTCLQGAWTDWIPEAQRADLPKQPPAGCWHAPVVVLLLSLHVEGMEFVEVFSWGVYGVGLGLWWSLHFESSPLGLHRHHMINIMRRRVV